MQQNAQYAKGDKVNAIFLLKKYDLRQAKNGSYYADMTLSNKNADYIAKLWDADQNSEAVFQSGIFVKVEANVQSYNDNLQFIINNIEAVKPTTAEIEELIETAPYPADKMYAKIIELINDMKNEDLKRITLALLEDNKDALMYFPAAKSFHHAIKGGLIYHTYTMLRAASSLLEIYSFLNSDLVYAGVILHDLGKITELSSTDYGVAGEYTKEGKLLGHITLGICAVDRKAAELNIDNEVSLLLKHMLLSHHFYPEFGSPVQPQFAEAELLHHLDVLDARMNQFEKTLQDTPYGEFTDRVWILDKRSVYNPLINTKENETEQ